MYGIGRTLGAVVLWSASAVAAAATSDLLISEYGEGSSFNKYIEIYNGTGAAIDLSNYQVWRVSNGGTWPEATIDLSGTLADGEVLVVYNPSADAAIAGAGDAQIASGSLSHNGDDAVGLAKLAGSDFVLIDTVGTDGPDPGAGWDVAGTTNATVDNNLVRKSDVCSPTTDWDASRGSDTSDSDWVVLSGINDFSDVGTHTVDCGGDGDEPPAVASTTPGDGTGNVALDAVVTISFTEPVTTAENAFSVICSQSGAIPFALSGGLQVYTLTPDVDFLPGEQCDVLVLADGVEDQDGVPDLMAGNAAFSFTTFTITRIHDIQGSGPSVTGAGPFTVEAVVVGDFQDTSQLRGFFIQEEDADADADPQTSEGIFVFCSSCPVDVAVGDRVQVTGGASDFFDMSQLSATGSGAITVLGTSVLPAPTVISLPVPVVSTDVAGAEADVNAFYEAFEGMLVQFAGDLAVSEYFQMARFGQIRLHNGARPRQFTDANAPTEAGFTAHQISLLANTMILDDDNNIQNAGLDFSDPAMDSPVFHPIPGFSTSNFVRGADTFENLTGVLHYSFAGSSGTDAWRVRPVVEAFSYVPTATSERSDSPADVGGSLKVAALNVLNYFVTLDEPGAACGPSALGCRGAHSLAELERQTQKIVAAICAMNADVVGLMELENDDTTTLSALADAVNDSCGTYVPLITGAVGTDAIKVAFLYKPTSVRVIGAVAILDDLAFTDPNNTGVPKNRPAVAATFEEFATGEALTIAVNHFKSKGSSCGAGDDDTQTGQGNCNLTRTLAATALADWLATKPTGTTTDNVLIIGDLNAYRKEDPIVALQSAGYEDLIDSFLGPDAYSFVFNGQIGYLDYALANEALSSKVTGITEWHINADEVNLLDYNDGVQDPGEAPFERKPTALPLFEANAFRSSDHDPVLVGLHLRPVPPAAPVCRGMQATIYVRDGHVVGGPLDGQRYRGLLFGSRHDDVIVGTKRRDIIKAGRGDDLVCARGGNDVVFGDRGNDELFGGSGRDFVRGGRGNDIVRGNRGADKLFGDRGNDLVFGGRGPDAIVIIDGQGNDFADGGKGRDVCRVDRRDESKNCEFSRTHYHSGSLAKGVRHQD